MKPRGETSRRAVLHLAGGGAGVAGALYTMGRSAQPADAAVTVIIGDVQSGNTIRIPVRNRNVADDVCAAVQAVAAAFFGQQLTCTIEAR